MSSNKWQCIGDLKLMHMQLCTHHQAPLLAINEPFKPTNKPQQTKASGSESVIATMPCVKWENVEVTGFKVFKWNERLSRNNIPEEEGVFIFRRDNGCIKRVIGFNIFAMVDRVPDLSTGIFSPRQDGLAFTSAFSNSNVFWTQPENQQLVDELNSFLQSFFEFSEFTVNCPSSPRLVFVVDFSYNPIVFVGCWSSWSHILNEPASLCTEAHDFQELSGLPLQDHEEDDALNMYAHADELDLSLGHVTEHADAEAGYSQEMRDIVRQLRLHRKVGKTYPMMPLCQGDPMGLVPVEGPLVETLKETSRFDCPICLYGMEVGEVVFKNKCGHLLHKTCSLSWFDSSVTCPLCRSYGPTVL